MNKSLNKALALSHYLSQPLRPNLHPAKSKPFLAQVLQRGADMIYCVIDAEEAIDEEAFRYSLFGA